MPLNQLPRQRFAAAASATVFALALVSGTAETRAGDWPQILGPTRDGIAAADERLAETWPAAGPPVLWKKAVGAGYAGLAVAGDQAILFHRLGDREVIEAIDAATGETSWSDGHATRFRPQVGGGDGPLCTPVIHDGLVITCGAEGMLSCNDATTGERRWSRPTLRDFAAPEGYFGVGSTPLVVGERVVVNVGGGRQGAGIVAFSLDTGETLWQATNEGASYAAPIAVAIDGRQHVLAVTRLGCLLLDPTDGAVLWRFPFGQRGPTVNAATPVAPRPGRLFVTAAYGIGGVHAAFDRTEIRPLWQGLEPLATQYCTPVVRGEVMYCIDGRDDVPPTALKCVDIETGRVLWKDGDIGYGTLLAADGKVVAVTVGGDVVLLRENPARAEILARARPLTGTLRALPALAAGRLYLRDDATLACLDLSR
jgi:outer membrane protein assembly factor BamB